MNAVISSVYAYSNAIDVVYTTSPERAILSSFGSQYPPGNMYGQEMGFGSLEEQTKVKRLWGIYIDNELYRVAETKSQIEEALQKLEEVVKEIGDLKEGEEMSYSSLFGKSDLMTDPD